MGELVIPLGLGAAFGFLIGACVAWLMRSGRAAREMDTAEGNWQR